MPLKLSPWPFFAERNSKPKVLVSHIWKRKAAAFGWLHYEMYLWQAKPNWFPVPDERGINHKTLHISHMSHLVYMRSITTGTIDIVQTQGFLYVGLGIADLFATMCYPIEVYNRFVYLYKVSSETNSITSVPSFSKIYCVGFRNEPTTCIYAGASLVLNGSVLNGKVFFGEKREG